MRIFTIALMLIPLVVANANGATARARVAASASPTTATTRAPATTGRVAARAATPATPAPAQKTVAARAAVAQKVVNNGTKIAGATQNTAVDSVCQQKFDGCMDSFCMLDNTNGGRCMCSDRGAELDAAMAEIEKLDEKSYQMATVGLDRIEMGDDADAAIANADAVADAIMNQESKTPNVARRTLDLSAWDTTLDFDDLADSIFASEESIQTQTGDALQRAAADLCAAQIPECEKDIRMLQMVYSQKVRSDCNAYENSIKQQKNASTQKLATAQRAMREAALEQLRTANKYDLGQCTTEFKKCMINTGGCGDDFSKCAAVAAFDSTNIGRSTSKKAKNYFIKGAATTIEINASTYDTLLAKQPLCMNVTKSCVAVRDQVWDTFLREVAPQLKSAELIAEDNVRQNCIGNISACFQKACKDTMDPNDPEGSYDMCLSRPGTMLNLCKVSLNACGIDSSSVTAAEQSNIWDYVVARLASMRVDSCTKEVKNCLQSEDRCGKDYTQCIGLDTDTIMRMCPYDKLIGCQKIYGDTEIRGDAVYDELATMVQGVMLNIDNEMLTKCQQAVDAAMIKVCGDTENCNGVAIDKNVGTRSLEYTLCGTPTNSNTTTETCFSDVAQIPDNMLYYNWRGVLGGIIDWTDITVNENGKIISSLLEASGNSTSELSDEINVLDSTLQRMIQMIEADPTIQYCMNGRTVQGMTRRGNAANATNTQVSEIMDINGNHRQRFPQLTAQMRQTIANAALTTAKEQYYAKYDKLSEKMLADFNEIGKRVAEINTAEEEERRLGARREMARNSCIALGDKTIGIDMWDISKREMKKLKKRLKQLKRMDKKFKDGTLAKNVLEYTFYTPSEIDTKDDGDPLTPDGPLSNAQNIRDDWNYKEDVEVTFEWQTLVCHKCTTTRNCEKKGVGKKCKTWDEPVKNCEDIQF